MNVSSGNVARESAGKPDALQTLRDKARPVNKSAKRLECVRLAGAFALPRRYAPLISLRFMMRTSEEYE